ADDDGAVDTATLQRILLANAAEAAAATLWVAPRLGTISPWSSKATDILRRRGLPIRRVERALALELEPLPDQASSPWQEMLAILHDPMTESVLTMRTAL